MNTIPFFYYDVLARIIPGGLLLGMLKAAGLRTPASLANLLTGPETWKAVAMPLIVAALAYLLGALLDGVFRFSGAAERFGRRQYGRVISEDRGLGRPIPRIASSEKFQHDAWQWLALRAGPKNTTAFSLAHRFQAESRLLVLSAVPAACLAGVSVSERLKIPCAGFAASAVAIGVLVLFVLAAFDSEKNRWVWTVAAISQMDSEWPERWKD
jgi:hypothetical protein